MWQQLLRRPFFLSTLAQFLSSPARHVVRLSRHFMTWGNFDLVAATTLHVSVMEEMATESCLLSGSCLGLNDTTAESLSLKDAWFYSIIATLMVSACGVVPIVFVPLDGAKSLNTPSGQSRLRLFLAFAVGSLLGDVFLHLLPETWRKIAAEDQSHGLMTSNGLMVIFGLVSFSFIEKLFHTGEDGEEEVGSSSDEKRTPGESVNVPPPRWVTGYLSVLANCIDNFTHGLAIGGSFLASRKVGILTTFAILIHEIPHEIADFAILVRSGFSRSKAAKTQLITCAGGLLGAATALWAESSEEMENNATWILPFAAGGFLNIALVNLLPELQKEPKIIESFKQMVCLSAGVLIMSGITHFFEM